MATFFLENFGCRATDADASSMRRSMLAEGFAPERDPARADVVVLNSCTVTAAADAQVREAVRKIHRANPSARILVTGCYAQRAPGELAALEGVCSVVGNSHQPEIPRLLRHLSFAQSPLPAQRSSDFVPSNQLGLTADPMSLARGPAKILTSDIFAQTAFPAWSVETLPSAGPQNHLDDRTRPILKVQDGCNNRCSYCVIPFVRGRSRSLPPDAVIAQVRRFVAAGAKEIVLSGINLGSYGRDLTPRHEFAELVERILAETSLDQLRFSSIEPQDVTEDFVALAASSHRVAPHFHIPLQSGSNRILRAMHRWYRVEHYAERLALIRRALPHAAIGADVIVGFPGETAADFEATAQFIERAPFSYLHVFSFSERPGTSAATLGDRVPPATIRERARHLRALSQQKANEFRASQLGRPARALTLARQSHAANFTEALTGSYIKLRVAGLHAANQWLEARITADPAEIVEACGPLPGHVAVQKEVPAARSSPLSEI